MLTSSIQKNTMDHLNIRKVLVKSSSARGLWKGDVSREVRYSCVFQLFINSRSLVEIK